MVRKLEDLKTPLSEKLVSSMNNRISERRTKATAVLIYFKNPNNYQEDLEQRRGNGIFQLPSKYLIRKEIKNIITRLYRKEPNQADINSAVLIEDDLPLSMIAEDLNLRAAQTNKSLQEELEETLRASKSPFARISTQNYKEVITPENDNTISSLYPDRQPIYLSEDPVPGPSRTSEIDNDNVSEISDLFDSDDSVADPDFSTLGFKTEAVITELSRTIKRKSFYEDVKENRGENATVKYETYKVKANKAIYNYQFDAGQENTSTVRYYSMDLQKVMLFVA
ncbi:hypothetical protein ACJJTC_013546 [Scirpophaga incertulas]